MIPLLLDELVHQVSLVLKKPPLQWKQSDITGEDLLAFEKEATEGAAFDTLGLKKGVWKAFRAGTMRAVIYECELARVAALLPEGVEIPLDAWGRIFQFFGKPTTGPHWRIYWFGAAQHRWFPEGGLPLDMEHLNGGYTTICSTRGIFIYRLEEATRVLIHELLHAACLDPHDKDIPTREATVETWAELIFVALRSGGSRSTAESLWNLQCQWVADTNWKAASHHKVKSKADYGWRYLNGRTHVYESLGFTLPPPTKTSVKRSRFTHPELGD
jgi:hypothetical protein